MVSPFHLKALKRVGVLASSRAVCHYAAMLRRGYTTTPYLVVWHLLKRVKHYDTKMDLEDMIRLTAVARILGLLGSETDSDWHRNCINIDRVGCMADLVEHLRYKPHYINIWMLITRPIGNRPLPANIDKLLGNFFCPYATPAAVPSETGPFHEICIESLQWQAEFGYEDPVEKQTEEPVLPIKDVVCSKKRKVEGNKEEPCSPSYQPSPPESPPSPPYKPLLENPQVPSSNGNSNSSSSSSSSSSNGSHSTG